MSIYAFPEQAGVKFRGINGVPRASEIAATYGPWYHISYEIGTSHASDPWTTWVKPQIDAAHAIGINCFRFMFSTALRSDFAPSLTSGQLATVLALFADYTASVGMWFYPTLTASQNNDVYAADDGLTLGSLGLYLEECAEVLSPYRHVAGFDVCQEVDSGGTGSFSYTNRAAMMTAVKNASSRPIPVTCSLVGVTTSAGLVWSRAAPIIAAGADFADYHAYFTPAISDLDPLVFNAGDGPSGDTDSPVIVGEMGILDTAGAGPVGARYDVMEAWAKHARLQAMVPWAFTDFGAGNEWGIFADTQNGSYVFTAPRSVQVNRVVEMPLDIQPYDADQDAFAVVVDAPVITARTSTEVTLSWNVAAGGSGTITYTPQYVLLDANGFPEGDWQSADPTTSTTAVIDGLTSDRYMFRVQSTGTSSGGGSGTTYSSWFDSNEVALYFDRLARGCAAVVR